MGRVLGRVDFGDGAPEKYFIHCATSGTSVPPLFADPEEAWKIYDADETGGLYAAVPKAGTRVRVVLRALAFSRIFPASGDLYGEPAFGLATDDRLLVPRGTECDEPSHSLISVEGVMHVAVLVDGGFAGDYEQALCDPSLSDDSKYERFGFDDFHGKPLDLCPHCVRELLSRTR